MLIYVIIADRPVLRLFKVYHTGFKRHSLCIIRSCCHPYALWTPYIQIIVLTNLNKKFIVFDTLVPVLIEKISDLSESLILPNADKRNYRSKIRMSTTSIAMIAVLAATLVGTTVLSTDSSFAYEKNQATSQANACGNGELPLNVGCQNIDSQIQGDENAVSLAADQLFPAFEEEEPEPMK